MLGAVVLHAALHAAVEHRVLGLHGHDGYARVHELGQVVGVEVRGANVADLALLLQVREVAGRLDATGDVVVPPVELHEVKRVLVEALQAAVYEVLHVVEADVAEVVYVGDELRVDLDLVGRRGAFARAQLAHELADELLGAPVDVGAIERGEAALHQHAERAHDVVKVKAALQRVPVRQLPAAVEHARDGVAGCKLEPLDHMRFIPSRQASRIRPSVR